MSEYHIRRDALGFYYHTPIDEESHVIEVHATEPDEHILNKRRGRPKNDPDSR